MLSGKSLFFPNLKWSFRRLSPREGERHGDGKRQDKLTFPFLPDEQVMLSSSIFWLRNTNRGAQMKETTDPSGAGECEDNNQQKIGRKNNRKRNRNNGRSRPSLSLSRSGAVVGVFLSCLEGWMDGFAVFRLVYDDSIDSMRWNSDGDGEDLQDG